MCKIDIKLLKYIINDGELIQLLNNKVKSKKEYSHEERVWRAVHIAQFLESLCSIMKP